MKEDKKDSTPTKGFFSNIAMKFGELAKRLGLISESDLNEALAKQDTGQSYRRIGKVLVDENKMTTNDVKIVLNSQVELESITATKEKKKPAKTTAKKSVKKKTAKKTTKKAVKKKPAKATTKKAAKKKPAKKKPTKA